MPVIRLKRKYVERVRAVLLLIESPHKGSQMKKKLGIVATFAVAALMTVPVSAHEGGTWIVKGGFGMVSPQDNNMFLDSLPLADGSVIESAYIQVDDGSSLVLSATYMLNDNWAVDILGAWPFEHDFEVTGTIDGSSVAVPVGKTKHLPPTVSIQYHFAPDATFQPFVGLGVNYTTFFSEDLESGIPDATGILDIDIQDSTGLAAQLGADWVFDEKWLASFDVRWIQIRSDLELTVDGGVVTLPPTLDIDPWVFSLTVGYKF